MGEQHFDGDGDVGVFRIAEGEAQILVDVVLQAHLTGLHELHYGDSREGFGDGCDAEDVIDFQGFLRLEIPVSEGVLIDSLVALHQDHRHSGGLTLVHIAEDGLLDFLVGHCLALLSIGRSADEQEADGHRCKKEILFHLI